MPRYAPELAESVIDQYLHTDKPVALIARDHAIDERDVTRIRHAASLPPRRTRMRSLPPAMAGLVEARALLRASAADVDDVGRNKHAAAKAGATRSAPSDEEDAMRHSASKTRVNALEAYCALPPLATSIDRIERLVEQELAAEEAGRAELGLLPRAPGEAERCARTLAILTRTLHALAQLRGGATQHGPHHDDDNPADIDEFRRDLARRIDAFVASRTDGRIAGGDSRAAPLDEAM